MQVVEESDTPKVYGEVLYVIHDEEASFLGTGDIHIEDKPDYLNR